MSEKHKSREKKWPLNRGENKKTGNKKTGGGILPLGASLRRIDEKKVPLGKRQFQELKAGVYVLDSSTVTEALSSSSSNLSIMFALYFQ